MLMIDKVMFSEEERKNRLFLPSRLNHAKIMGLNDKEFAQLHLELMMEYREKDGWWIRAGIPNCSNCKEAVPCPEQLVRYHGRTLHHLCFREEWKKERQRYAGSEQKYWDRISRLPLNSHQELQC